jgi:uncharacterized RDD family membrane protein YckC
LSNAPLPSIDPFAPPAANLDPRLGAGGGQLASRGARFGGALLDGLVAMPFVIIGMVVAASVSGGGMAALSKVSPLNTVIFFACGLPLNILQWYLVATKGQTLGKRWLKTKIVKKDGGNVDFVSGVVLRYWSVVGLSLVCNLLNLAAVGGLFGFVDALFVFRGDRRTLHDLIAGTKVVNADPNA